MCTCLPPDTHLRPTSPHVRPRDPPCVAPGRPATNRHRKSGVRPGIYNAAHQCAAERSRFVAGHHADRARRRGAWYRGDRGFLAVLSVHLDLTDEETLALLNLLTETIRKRPLPPRGRWGRHRRGRPATPRRASRAKPG